jgi:hypothetical protein
MHSTLKIMHSRPTGRTIWLPEFFFVFVKLVIFLCGLHGGQPRNGNAEGRATDAVQTDAMATFANFPMGGPFTKLGFSVNRA